MTDETIEEMLIKMTADLGRIEAKLDSMNSSVLSHESRLSKLELEVAKMPSQQSSQPYNWIIQWLIRCLVVSLGIIGTSTGSAALISKLVVQ